MRGISKQSYFTSLPKPKPEPNPNPKRNLTRKFQKTSIISTEHFESHKTKRAKTDENKGKYRKACWKMRVVDGEESVSRGHVLNRILSLSFPHLKAKRGKPVGSKREGPGIRWKGERWRKRVWERERERGKRTWNGPESSLEHGGRDEGKDGS